MKYKTVNKEEVRVYKNIPAGWKIDEFANNYPVGTKWITNGKSRFPKNGKPAEHKSALLVTDEKALIVRIATNRRRGWQDGFKTDKTTETKVQAEIKRLNRSSAATVAKKCPAKAAAKKPMRTVRKPMTAKKTSTPVKKK